MFSFFTGDEKQSVVLIDVSSGSVGGAFAHFSKKHPPRVYFTARMAIETSPSAPPGSAGGARSGSPIEEDMLGTLEAVTKTLIEGGARVLQEETGSAHVDSVLVSIGSPWQETKIEVKTLAGEKPFLFTRTMLEDAVRPKTPEEKIDLRTDPLVIATLLNGYEVHQPFGKRAHRADLIVLSSTLHAATASAVEDTLRKTYRTHHIEFTAFAPLAYTVFRDLYPHEKEFLVLDFSGEATDIAFVKGSLLVDVSSIPIGVHKLWRSVEGEHHGSVLDLTQNAKLADRVSKAEGEWLAALIGTLRTFASRHALPRTLFLLASGDTRDAAKKLLDNQSLRGLWLSDEPLRILPVMPSQFAKYLETRGSAEGDVSLAMLALFHHKRFKST